MSLTITDLFCGAGGSAQGAAAVPGIELRLAANHWQLAVESHAANFPAADHLVADISQVDPRRVPRTDLLWASPECTNHSQAKGVKRFAQPDLFGETLPSEAVERSRATMWDVPRFAEQHAYRAIVVENVVDAARSPPAPSAPTPSRSRARTPARPPPGPADRRRRRSGSPPTHATARPTHGRPAAATRSPAPADHAGRRPSPAPPRGAPTEAAASAHPGTVRGHDTTPFERDTPHRTRFFSGQVVPVHNPRHTSKTTTSSRSSHFVPPRPGRTHVEWTTSSHGRVRVPVAAPLRDDVAPPAWDDQPPASTSSQDQQAVLAGVTATAATPEHPPPLDVPSRVTLDGVTAHGHPRTRPGDAPAGQNGAPHDPPPPPSPHRRRSHRRTRHPRRPRPTRHLPLRRVRTMILTAIATVWLLTAIPAGLILGRTIRHRDQRG